MALLDASRTDSLEARKASAANEIRVKIMERFRFLCTIQREGIDMVWSSKTGLTPQQVCDSLGTDAGSVFGFHGILSDAIIQAAQAEGFAPDIKYPTNKFTINPDGTVTVLEEPYFEVEEEEEEATKT